MRHHNANRKLSRKTKVRKALLNSLAQALILHEKIRTTEAKAKELRPFVEKLITNGKLGTVATRRAIKDKVGVAATKVLVDNISKKYEKREGGYTRITKSVRRLSDGSKMAFIELV